MAAVSGGTSEGLYCRDPRPETRAAGCETFLTRQIVYKVERFTVDVAAAWAPAGLQTAREAGPGRRQGGGGGGAEGGGAGRAEEAAGDGGARCGRGGGRGEGGEGGPGGQGGGGAGPAGGAVGAGQGGRGGAGPRKGAEEQLAETRPTRIPFSCD